jgi:hypothetical protein
MQLSPRQQIWLDILIGLLAVSPLFLTAHIPLVDLPNHLARQHVLKEIAGSSALQTFYTIKLALVPNLALEIFVGLAGLVMPIDWAMRLFCIVTILLLYLGTRFSNQALAGPQARLYRFAPFLCYGGPFQFGFLSFCFGVGVALLLFALYLHCRRRPLWVQLLILMPAGFGLLLCHMAAFGIWALAIGSYELAKSFPTLRALTAKPDLLAFARRCLRVAAILVPPLAIMVMFGPPTPPSVARIANFREKIEGLAAITLFSNPTFEFALWSLAASGLVIALYTRAVRASRMAVVMLIVVGVVYLALPRSAGDTGYIDYRVPWCASFFLLAALMPAEASHRLQNPLRLYFSALVAGRLALIAVLWLSWEPVIAEVVDALKTLPIGARLMVVEGKLESRYKMRDPGLVHLPAYAVAYRQAFEPALFASLGGQILYFQPAYLKLWAMENPETLAAVDPMYSHVLLLRPAAVPVAPGLPLRCLAHGADFALFATDGAGDPAELSRCGFFKTAPAAG